jgi:hypothetical protein
MNGPDAVPLPVQVLQDQAPVAVLGPGLAAQQYRGNVEQVFVQSLLDPAFPQQVQERPLVTRPSAAVSVGVEDLARRGESGFVDVLCIAELFQEERKVSATGEAGELRGIVQSNVE